MELNFLVHKKIELEKIFDDFDFDNIDTSHLKLNFYRYNCNFWVNFYYMSFVIVQIIVKLNFSICLFACLVDKMSLLNRRENDEEIESSMKEIEHFIRQ